MAIYRDNLPQMRGGLFLSAGVIETSGGDHEGMEQSSFTALQLPDDVERTAAMRTFYSHCVEVAKAAGMGLILESPTWRPSHDRTGEPQPSRSDLERASRHVMGLLEGIRAGVEDLELVVSGCLGPWGDGDEPGQRMSVQEAHDYYVSQIRILTDAKADMLCALTLHYPEEAIGIAKAAQALQMPLAIGFMVESDGRLPGGQPLQEVIEQVDDQTDSYPLYYLISCAHPSHFEQVLLEGSGPWRERIRGLRVSASACRHDEPAQTATPDSGDPEAEVLAHHYVTLKQQFGHLNIFGGCWGGDPVAAMARALRGMV